MRISQLQYFSTIARLENVSQAAENLHLSQSSLSKNLALLEEEMGASLFERNGRRLILNPAGARMLEFSNKVLQDLETVKEDIHEISTGTEKRLRIGTAGYCDRIGECLAAFQKAHPGTEYELIGSIEADDHLDIGEYDMLVYPDEREYEKYTGYPLYEERYMLAVRAGHPLAGQPFVRMKALEWQSMVFIRSGDTHPEYPLQICDALALQLGSRNFVDSRELHRRMISEGVGIGFVPASCASFYKSDPDVKLIPVHDKRLARKMMVCFRKEKYLSETGRAFRDHVLAYYSLPESGHSGNAAGG